MQQFLDIPFTPHPPKKKTIWEYKFHELAIANFLKGMTKSENAILYDRVRGHINSLRPLTLVLQCCR